MGESERSKKVCFVTIGATAAFDSLLKAVLNPAFLKALEKFEYTDLRLQYGTNGASILSEYSEKEKFASLSNFKVNVTGFDFKKEGLGAEMKAARDGVVISHAGIPAIEAGHRIER